MRLLSIICIFFNLSLQASEWVDVKIPGAKCGDGSPYSVFIQNKSNTKLLVEFMGGGVCWDYKSCFQNVSIFPWLHRYPVIDSYSIVTANNSSRNPFKEHSKIYFPYCTADVHSGSHISFYRHRKVFHYGKKNIELAFKYLLEKKLVDKEAYNELVVYGASAGAIASLVHSYYFQNNFPNLKSKYMFVDSPGLHFGEDFWKKFDQQMILDFKETFSAVDLNNDFNNGAVSKYMGPVLDNYSDWTIGFIYGLRDYVMSKVFGEISPENHRSLILSVDGLPFVARNNPNVHFWVKDTSMHTFMLSRYSSSMKSMDDETVDQFVTRLYSNK
jgi:hypothetical protein